MHKINRFLRVVIQSHAENILWPPDASKLGLVLNELNEQFGDLCTKCKQLRQKSDRLDKLLQTTDARSQSFFFVKFDHAGIFDLEIFCIEF